MNTSYKRNIVSPIQLRNKPYDIKQNTVVQEEIRKNIRTINFSAEFVEDTQTLQLFKNIPGVIAFSCILKRDGQTIGVGRGMSVVSKTNRYMEKTVNFAQNSALIDATVRATKMLDVLHLTTNLENGVKSALANNQETYTEELITEKQKSYLTELININVDDDEDREYKISQLENLTKMEASEMIQEFKR